MVGLQVTTTPPQLALCEPYHPSSHGQSVNSSVELPGHIMCIETLGTGDLRHAQDMANMAPPAPRAQHPFIRAYSDICRHSRLFGPQIVRVHELSGGETIAIIRTGGLRRLQRKIRSLRTRV